MKDEQEKLKQEVETWWNTNPFAFGVANDSKDQVGTISPSDMNLEYFEEIERKFRKHSNGGAQNSDNEPLFNNLIDYSWLEGKDVLDIAVGSGFSMVEFIRQGAKSVIGIDITDFAVHHSKRNLLVRNLKGEVKKMDAQDMSFPDNTFDFVCAWGCYMHMPDIKQALKETCRVLRPGGRVMAYMYNRDSWPFWFNIVLLRGILLGGLFVYRGNITKLTSRYSDGYSLGGNPFTKFYSKRKARRMFSDAGFVNVTSVPFKLRDEPNSWPLRRLPLFKYLPEVIKHFISRWGYAQILTAQKPL